MSAEADAAVVAQPDDALDAASPPPSTAEDESFGGQGSEQDEHEGAATMAAANNGGNDGDDGDAHRAVLEEEDGSAGDSDEHHQEFQVGSGDKGAVPMARRGKSCFARAKARVAETVQLYPDLVGFGLNTVAALVFSVVNMLVKLGGNSGIGPFQMVFCRNLVQLALGCINTVAASSADRNPFGRPNKKVTPLLVARGVLGICTMTCNFYSVQLMQIEEATIISFLTPVFTALIGYFFLKEKLTKLEILGMPFSFIGILLVSAPPSLLSLFGLGGSSASSSSSDDLFSSSNSMISANSSCDASSTSLYWGVLTPVWKRTVGAIFGLLGCLGTATAYVMTRTIGKRVHHTVIINWLSLCGVTLPLLPMFLLEGFKVPHGKTWAYVASIGVVAFGAQTFLTTALRTGAAGRVAVANYTGIIWAFLWGIIVFHQPPEVLSYFGTIFIGINAAIAVYKAWFIGKHAQDVKHVELKSVASEHDDEEEEEHHETEDEETHSSEHTKRALLAAPATTPGLPRGVTPILP